MTTLTLDLPAADEAALRELANAPAQARAAALQEAIEVLRRGAATNGATGNGHHTKREDAATAPETARPETARPLTAREILAAPPDVREAAMKASAEVAARFYATPEGEAELADWRALQGEDFYGFEDEDAAQEERKAA